MSVPYAGGYLGLGNSFTSQNRDVEPVGGWVELGRTTLGSAGDTIDVSSLDDKRYYMILTNILFDSANYNFYTRMNADSGNNYAGRRSEDGATDITSTNADFITFTSDALSGDSFNVGYAANLSTKEKLWQSHLVLRSTAGAGTAPSRGETVGKHAQTSNPITAFNMLNTFGSNKFSIGSECVVLGWDPADTHTDNFWEELASVDLSGGAATTLSSGTITAKKYLWIQFFGGFAAASNHGLQFNNDTGSNYATRRSIDGGADGTFTGETLARVGSVAIPPTPYFANIFIINNSANEKLGISHGVAGSTAGAGTAPRRREDIFKWDNTAAQITEIDLISTTANNMTTNTIMKVWGSD